MNCSEGTSESIAPAETPVAGGPLPAPPKVFSAISSQDNEEITAQDSPPPPTQAPPDVQKPDATPTPWKNYRQYLPEGEYDEAALGPALSSFQAKLSPPVAKEVLGFLPQAMGFAREALRDGQGLDTIEEKLAAALWSRVQAAGGTLRDMKAVTDEWERFTKRAPDALFGFTPSPPSPTEDMGPTIARMRELDELGLKGGPEWNQLQAKKARYFAERFGGG